jgi:signal transduction histidine kinase
VQPLLSVSRFRLSSAALALALVLGFGGLYAVDRALSKSRRTQVQVEAVETAALVQGFLAVHAQALQSIRGLFLLDTARPIRDEHFRSLVGSMTQYATLFSGVWLADSAGVVRHQYVFGGGVAALPEGLDIDTLQLLSTYAIVQRARTSRHTQISPPGTALGGERGVIIVEPLYIGERLVGFAGGMLTGAAILQSAERRHPHPPGFLAILAGRDTIAAVSNRRLGSAVTRATAGVRTPGGGVWRVIVAQASNYDQVRLLLWGVGLATLGALFWALLHERRQALRLEERTGELERLSSELLRANRVKSEFLANVSHELRTPLNAIVGFVDLLRDGVYGDLSPRQVGPVERIASSANHLRQLVDQVLDLAKMAAGRLEVHPELVDLRPFVLNVASEVEALVGERGLNLSIAVSAALPRVRTDPMHLRQILLNLLSNAVKFTPSGGIAIRARLVGREDGLPEGARRVGGEPPPVAGAGQERQAWVALQVADSGIGIAQADRARIFEEFEQVNAGPRGESMQRGTGLGLPISRRLARLLGGDVTVESEPNKGSTFTVWLPADAAPRDHAAHAAGATDDASAPEAVAGSALPRR